MPARKPTDLVQVGLRLREDLRQRVVNEARKNHIPINRELHRRIEQSFEIGMVRSLEAVAADMASTWSRIRKGGGINP